MNTKLLAAIALSSVFIVSCGKKDDLQTKEEKPVAERTVKPIVLDADDNGSTNFDKSMTLSKPTPLSKPAPLSKPTPVKPMMQQEAIDTTKSYKNDAPMFDTGMRPSSSK